MLNTKSTPIFILMAILAITLLACGGSGTAVEQDVPDAAPVEAPVEQVAAEPEPVEQVAAEPEPVDPTANWETFSSEAGNFSIRLPKTPEEQVQTVPSPIGDTEVHVFMADMGAAAYLVSYNEFPDIPADPTVKDQAIETAFDQARDSFLNSVAASVVDEETIAFDDYQAREIEFTVAESTIPGGGTDVVRMMAVGTRFYQLAALGADGALPEAELDAFLTSFALLEAPVEAEVAPVEVDELAVAAGESAALAEAADEAVEPVDSNAVPDEAEASSQPSSDGAAEVEAAAYDTDFPLPATVQTFVNMGDDAETVNFQTDLTLDEAVAFYRQELIAQGLVERTILTQITEGVFSIVFDGSPNGRAMVIQGVDLGGSTNISIRYEDV